MTQIKRAVPSEEMSCHRASEESILRWLPPPNAGKRDRTLDVRDVKPFVCLVWVFQTKKITCTFSPEPHQSHLWLSEHIYCETGANGETECAAETCVWSAVFHNNSRGRLLTLTMCPSIVAAAVYGTCRSAEWHAGMQLGSLTRHTDTCYSQGALPLHSFTSVILNSLLSVSLTHTQTNGFTVGYKTESAADSCASNSNVLIQAGDWLTNQANI